MSCPDCFSGSIHTHATPQGTFKHLHGHNTYIASGPSTSTTSSPPTKKNSTIIYLPDAFGVSLINNRLLADRYAAETGCTVLLPDIIPGGGAPVTSLGWMDVVMGPRPAWWDVISWGRKVVAVGVLVWYMVPFMIWSRPGKGYDGILAYARNVRKDVDDRKEGGKLGVCGFCWGGFGSTMLCTETKEEGSKERLIDAQFCAHPSGLKTPGMVVDAIAKFGVPYSCAVPEHDMLFTTKAAEETEAVLREKVGPAGENHYEFVVHKGCGHGFAVRASPSSKVEFQGLEDAARQAVNWFNRYL